MGYADFVAYMAGQPNWLRLNRERVFADTGWHMASADGSSGLLGCGPQSTRRETWTNATQVANRCLLTDTWERMPDVG